MSAKQIVAFLSCGLCSVLLTQVFLRVYSDLDAQIVDEPDELPKVHFDEVVGMTGEEARAFIVQDPRTLGIKYVHLIESGTFVTMDYRLDRIRIFLDDDGRVAEPPRNG